METYIQDIPMPEESKKRWNENREIIENYEKGKKLREQYPPLRKRLEAIRESRPVQQTSFKDQRAFDHFDFLKKQQDEQLAQLEANFEKVKAQFEQGRQNILRKKLYVEQKLEKAKERVETQTTIKTKEELLLEKNIAELIQKHIELQPAWDLSQSFPNYKELNINLSLPNTVKEEVIEVRKENPLLNTPHPPPPSVMVGGEVEQKSSTVSLPKNPYGNVIFNTKAKRKAKECDAQ
jgi:hypothetical protein